MMTGTYDLKLVALSYVVAVFASYIALELTARVRSHEYTIARYWLAGGSVALGLGIWTMHFVGMLAYEMRLPYSYDATITIVSLIIAVLASLFALWIASRKTPTFARIGISGVLLGIGIAAMHYTGIAAMRIDADIAYQPLIVAASVVVAVVASTVAIWIIFRLADIDSERMKLTWVKSGAAAILGLAICGMHYLGMTAVSFVPDENAYILHVAESNPHLAIQLASAVLVILGIAHLTAFFDARISAEHERLSVAEEHALQLSELLDESLNEIYVIDVSSLRIVNVNKGACEHLGYRREQLKSMTPLDITPALTEERLRARLDELANSSESVDIFEGTHLRSDGSTYPVEINLQLSKVLGRPVALVIVSDITRRKQLEDQLMQSKKLESIGQLAAGIAHEINTPAQYVGDNTRFVQDSMADMLKLSKAFQRLYAANKEFSVTPELLEECAEVIRAADIEYLEEEVPAAIDQTLDGITRITRIVRAMKEFSHPGGKNQEPSDINRIIENTITVASNEWKYVADVSTDLGSDIPSVSCMPQEISQVILNLIVNAAHAIGDSLEKGSTAKGTIHVQTRRLEDHAEIRISDTGGGIPDSVADRVFDPFFTTKEVGKGTGQGLSMAYKTIVNAHSGEISFESDPGVGTTFVILLPLESRNAEFEEVVA